MTLTCEGGIVKAQYCDATACRNWEGLVLRPPRTETELSRINTTWSQVSDIEAINLQ